MSPIHVAGFDDNIYVDNEEKLNVNKYKSSVNQDIIEKLSVISNINNNINNNVVYDNEARKNKIHSDNRLSQLKHIEPQHSESNNLNYKLK